MVGVVEEDLRSCFFDEVWENALDGGAGADGHEGGGVE